MTRAIPLRLMTIGALPIIIVLASFITCFFTLNFLFYVQAQDTKLQTIRNNLTVEIWPESAAIFDSETKRATAFLAAQAEVLTYKVFSRSEVLSLLGSGSELALQEDLPIFIEVKVRDGARSLSAKLEKSLQNLFPTGKITAKDFSNDENFVSRDFYVALLGLAFIMGSFLIIIYAASNTVKTANKNTFTQLRLFGSLKYFYFKLLLHHFLRPACSAYLASLTACILTLYLHGVELLSWSLSSLGLAIIFLIPLFYLGICFLLLYLGIIFMLKPQP